MHFESVKGKFSIQIPGNLLEDIAPKFVGLLHSQTWRSIYKNSIYGVEYCLFDKIQEPKKIPAVLDLMTRTTKEGCFINGEIYSKTLFKKGSVDCLKSIVFGKPNLEMHEYFEKYNLPIESKIVYRIGVICFQRNRMVEAFMSTTDMNQMKLGKQYLSTLQLKF